MGADGERLARAAVRCGGEARRGALAVRWVRVRVRERISERSVAPVVSERVRVGVLPRPSSALAPPGTYHTTYIGRSRSFAALLCGASGMCAPPPTDVDDRFRDAAEALAFRMVSEISLRWSTSIPISASMALDFLRSPMERALCAARTVGAAASVAGVAASAAGAAASVVGAIGVVSAGFERCGRGWCGRAGRAGRSGSTV